MPKVLILEDSSTIIRFFRDRFSGEPMEVVIVETAAEARELFKSDSFDIIALDGIAPSAPGQRTSLVGPLLARELRDKGYKGLIVAISGNAEAQALTKKAAGEKVPHRAYICEKTDLPGLIRELLGLYSAPK